MDSEYDKCDTLKQYTRSRYRTEKLIEVFKELRNREKKRK